MTFSGSGFAPGEQISFTIVASSRAVPNERGSELLGEWGFNGGSAIRGAWVGDERISDTLTASSQGDIEIVYYPMSGEYYRKLQASYGDALLPITHKMTAVGNRTNRSAAATYVQDSSTS